MNDSEGLYGDRPELWNVANDRQSWEWLAGLARRLGVNVELLDPQGRALLPDGRYPERDTVRRLLATDPDAFQKGIRDALYGSEPAFLTIARQAVAFIGLATRPRYVLAIARPATQSPDQPRQIHAIGMSVAAAVEAQLRTARPPAEEVFDRLSALQRVLARAAEAGRERDVVRAFAEALAIWEDIEVRGYVENVDGLFVLDIMLPGSLRSEAALVLDRIVAGDAPITRIAPADAERLGFAAGLDVLIARLGTRWQLALSGHIPRGADARLKTYAAIVADAVERASNVAISRTTWSMLEVLVGAGDQFEPAANHVIELLKAELKATAAVLMVSAPGDRQLLASGDTSGFEQSSERDNHKRLVYTAPVGSHHRMTLGVTRVGDAFYRPEQRVLEAVGRLLVAWLPTVLARSAIPRDRRQQPLSATEIIDRHTRRTLDAGDSVSLVLVADPGAVLQPGRLRQYVAAIRAQIRPGDVAAVIDDQEVAVLLPSTDKESAAIVVDRLQHEVMAPFGARWHIGVAAHAAGTADGSLIEGARRDAQDRAGFVNS